MERWTGSLDDSSLFCLLRGTNAARVTLCGRRAFTKSSFRDLCLLLFLALSFGHLGNFLPVRCLVLDHSNLALHPCLLRLFRPGHDVGVRSLRGAFRSGSCWRPRWCWACFMRAGRSIDLRSRCWYWFLERWSGCVESRGSWTSGYVASQARCRVRSDVLLGRSRRSIFSFSLQPVEWRSC